jgi:uncharacterized membrane protein HdeD (DUF308 family)
MIRKALATPQPALSRTTKEQGDRLADVRHVLAEPRCQQSLTDNERGAEVVNVVQAETPDIETAKLLPHAWKAALASGLVAVMLGVLILMWPGISILVASVLFGVYLLAIGCAQVFAALTLPVSAGGRFLLFIGGGAALIVAILTFRHFGQAIAVLLMAIWIAIGFIFRGVATTVAAISHPDLPARGWQVFFGILSLLAGIIVLAAPFPSIVTLAFAVGVCLVVIGAFEIISAVRMRGDVKRVPVRVRPTTGSAA